MKYLLDTNICVYFFRGKYHMNKRIEANGIENCAISEITLAELVYGAECSSSPKKNHRLIADLTEQIAVVSIFDSILEYGQQKAQLKRQGILISDFDLLIGSTAITNNLTLVTQNVKDFERLKGITLENWVIG